MSKFFSKFKNPFFGPFLVYFPNFGGKSLFLRNPALSRTTSYGFLEPSQNLEKTNDTIPRKCPNRYRTLPATAGCPKTKNHLFTETELIYIL